MVSRVEGAEKRAGPWYALTMSNAFDDDYYTWTKTQAEALRRRSANELDWDLLSQELDALGQSEERELNSRYRVLLTHLLKWIMQPERRSRSWETTIRIQRRDLARHLGKNPGLKRIEAEEFEDAYQVARLQASNETDLEFALFPEQPPFTMDQAKDETYWPQ
jgi:hypothetical protein